MSSIVWATNNQRSYSGRACQVLSDGSVAVLVQDSTAGVDSVIIEHSRNRLNWTVIAAIAPTVGDFESGGIFGVMGFSTDANDNIYVLYSTTIGVSHKLFYRKLTKGTGYSWTVGSEEVVYDNPFEWQFMDVDMLAPDQPIVVGTWYSPAGAAAYGIFLRTDSGLWTVPEAVTLGAATAKYEVGRACTIARDAAGPSGGVAKFAVIIDKGVAPGASGDLMYVGTVNTATGALTKTIGQILFSNSSNLQRFYNLFSTGPGEYTAMGRVGTYITAARFNNLTEYLTNWLPAVVFEGFNEASGVSFSWGGSCGLATININGYWIDIPVRDLGLGRLSIGPAAWWDQLNNVQLGTPLAGGSNRNFNWLQHDHLRYLAAGIIHMSNEPPPGVSTDQPADGATIATSDPRFGAHIYVPRLPQVRMHPIFISLDQATGETIYEGRDLTNNFSFGPNGNAGTTGPPVLFAGVVTAIGGKYHQHTFTLNSAFEDELGVWGPVSAASTYTVSHAPSAVALTPAKPLAYTTGDTVFTWQFSDPWSGDSQTSYEIVIERNDNGLGLYDSGKVAGTDPTATINLATSFKDIPLRWKVRVWDADDVAGNYSDYKLFEVDTPPVVGISSPATAEIVATPSPLVTWTYTSSLGRAEATYAVRVVDVTFADPKTVYNSGVLSGAATSLQLPAKALPRDRTLILYVDVTDSKGVPGSQTQNFTTHWDGPPQPLFTIDEATFQTLGYVTVSWNGSPIDPYFTSWSVYRRPVGTDDYSWVQIFNTFEIAPSYIFHDWGAGSGITYDYIVVQEGLRFGSPVESTYSVIQTVTPLATEYWLIYPADETMNVRLGVTADSFADEYEELDIKLIGRGVKKEYGTEWGFKGSLTCQAPYSADNSSRTFRLALEALKRTRQTLLLRNPFGDIWQVAASDIAIARTPSSGHIELHTATIPYQEVR